MKTYSKILGVLSGIIVLALFGLLIYILIVETKSESNVISILILLLPVYILGHFLIIHRFGFNLNTEYTNGQRTTIVVTSIIALLISITPILFAFNKMEEKRSFQVMKDMGLDYTAYNYNGHLKIKYVDRQIFYIIHISSSASFDDNIPTFTINLLDKDGFLITEFAIIKYTRVFGEDNKFIGIESNTNAYMDIEEYSRIENWDLVVRK